MESVLFSRVDLESLSTNELISLADKKGIDIPEGLNRRFIIGEILELEYEDNKKLVKKTDLLETDVIPKKEKLPFSYNETTITALLRDPGWIFVYWDFHSNDIKNQDLNDFFLRVNTLNSGDANSALDFYDVQIGNSDRKWYVHFPGNGKFCRIDLCAKNLEEKEVVLAKTLSLEIPTCVTCSAKEQVCSKTPPILDLSGIKELKKSHFKNHRESF